MICCFIAYHPDQSHSKRTLIFTNILNLDCFSLGFLITLHPDQSHKEDSDLHQHSEFGLHCTKILITLQTFNHGLHFFNFLLLCFNNIHCKFFDFRILGLAIYSSVLRTTLGKIHTLWDLT